MWGCLEIGGFRCNYPDGCVDGVFESEQGRFVGIGGSWGPPKMFDKCAKTMPDSRYICAPVFVLCWLAMVENYGWQRAICRNLTFYLKTFLLQVMGGAGAMWGFSEICGKAGYSLRYGWGDVYFGQKSFDFWRVVCGVTFVLCLIRWICVIVIPGPPKDWNGSIPFNSNPDPFEGDAEIENNTQSGATYGDSYKPTHDETNTSEVEMQEPAAGGSAPAKNMLF